jgi:hypothetical protein
VLSRRSSCAAGRATWWAAAPAPTQCCALRVHCGGPRRPTSVTSCSKAAKSSRAAT